MVHTITAIFEHGVFKPLKKLRLREHQRFVIKVEIPQRKDKALRETIEILNDEKQLNRISRALAHVRQGRLLSHKDVFGHPQPKK